MSKTLNGINLLEFHSNMAAAYTAMMLAEQGADAVKIEPLGGAAERGTAHFHVLNRSKRMIFLDLMSHEAKDSIPELIKRADIVVNGMTPSDLRAHGLDYASVRRINPRALAVYVPPLGSQGPEADLDASDDLVAAQGGIYGSQWSRSGNPMALTFPAASYSAGVMAASAAVAALIAREQTGEGQEIEVSILAGAFSLQTGAILRHEKMTRLYHGPQDPMGPVPVYRLFETADKKYVFAACGNATFWGKFAIAIGMPELVSDPRFEGAPWGVSAQYRQTLKDIIAAVIRTRSCDEWLAILREADVPCAPVITRDEFIEWPQTVAVGMRREIDDPTLGKTIQPGIPIGLVATPGAITGPAPSIREGISVREAFKERTSEPQAQAKALSMRGPLEGITVLDFASYIAGSYGPMILAQLGADVIKIESLEGDSFRNFGFGFLGWNQNKRGLALDLTSREGLEIIFQLAERADVVVENLRPGRMARFGLDYESLAKRNPGLIYVSVNGFGNSGPEHNQPGFDPLLQARSGVMAAQGGPHEPPVYLTCAICDYGAAMLSAMGALLALYARLKTGRGQFCETSLLQAAMAFQAGEFAFYNKRPLLENGGAEYRGRSALCRAYECRNGEWMFLTIDRASQWDALREMFTALSVHEFARAQAESNEGDLAQKLAYRFANSDRAGLLASLRASGIPAGPVNRIHDLFDDPQIAANELIAQLPHSQWGQVRQTGALMKFSSTPQIIQCAAPLLGEHTDQILHETLGYEASRIADLRARGVLK